MSYHPRMVCHGTLTPTPPEPTPTPDQKLLDEFHAMQARSADIAARLRNHPSPATADVGAAINTSTATPIGSATEPKGTSHA